MTPAPPIGNSPMLHDRTGNARKPRPDPAGARPVPFRGGGLRPRRPGLVAPAVLIDLIALWELGSRPGLTSHPAPPPPPGAVGPLPDPVETGMLWKHVGSSVSRLVLGWTLGTVAGVAAGFAIGLFSLARAGLLPVVSALFPVPKIALLPLFIIWFGIGEGSKIATIFFGTFFPIVIATYGGVDNVDRNLVRMGQSFGLAWWSIVRKIILPGAL